MSNLVGDAIAMKRSFVNPSPVIGVNAWGAVHGNKDLIEGEEQVLHCFIHEFKCFIRTYYVESILEIRT